MISVLRMGVWFIAVSGRIEGKRGWLLAVAGASASGERK